MVSSGQRRGAAEARLIELLADQKSSIHVEAAFALWKLRPTQAFEALDVLARALADPDESARASAADHLAEIGPEAAPAVPGLTRALADQSDSVRNLATNALGKIGAPAKVAMPALLRAAAHRGHWFFLEKAVKGIGAEAVPALIDGLDDPKSRIPGGRRQLLASSARWRRPPLHAFFCSWKLPAEKNAPSLLWHSGGLTATRPWSQC